MIEVIQDVETTGLNSYKNGIIQIAGIILNNGKEVERFNIPMKPGMSDVVDQKALEANGITLEELSSDKRMDSRTAYQQYCQVLSKYISKFNKLDKAFFVAYNAKFDEQFVRDWFKKHGDNYFGSWYWTPSLDVMTFAGLKLRSRRQSLVDFKLSTVAKALDIQVKDSELHDAMYDVELTALMYEKLKELL